jgi:nicotinate-nucleotide pyrophosphorylase (carboxylating)
MELDIKDIKAAVTKALAEDIGPGDITTLALIHESKTASGVMIAKEPAVLAGIRFAEIAFTELSKDCQVTILKTDGSKLQKNDPILKVSGPARALLSAERTALNFVQRLSGIATLTSRFVEAIQGTKAKILDTRKTTPGWRLFEKYAVSCGGGVNHRIGLFDMILIKDNHLAVLKDAKPNPVFYAITEARKKYPSIKVEVEVENIQQVAQAIEARADIILLDNMSIDEIKQSVQLVKGQAKTEASGGVTLKTVRKIAETGVDFISVGSITHSATAIDIGLDFEV